MITVYEAALTLAYDRFFYNSDAKTVAEYMEEILEENFSEV